MIPMAAGVRLDGVLPDGIVLPTSERPIPNYCIRSRRPVNTAADNTREANRARGFVYGTNWPGQPEKSTGAMYRNSETRIQTLDRSETLRPTKGERCRATTLRLDANLHPVCEPPVEWHG
jgi:hypothetical protein